MTVTLVQVLGMLYGIAIGGALGMSVTRTINATFDQQPATKPVSLFEALDKVLHRAVTFFAFTFVMMWLIQSSENMTEPSIALLVSTNIGWRMYVLLSVFGVSLIMSALEFFLGAVLQRIGQFISPRLVARFKAVRP